MRNTWMITGFGFTLFLYSLYSYTQVDPNLVLSSQQWFWEAQQLWWKLGYQYRLISTVLYAFIVLGMFFFYLTIIKAFYQRALSLNDFKRLILISILTLLPAYPALSHDVFNYAMNAKMVWKYNADPHRQVALDFPNDPWLAYMHNVHTPAPYARGWTLASLPFGYLGGENIKLNIINFKAFVVMAYIALVWIIPKLPFPSTLGSIALLALNPLLLIETIGNVHNDVIMMALSMGGLLIFMKGYTTRSTLKLAAGIVLWLLSIFLKYASIMLFIGFVLYWLSKHFKRTLSWGGAQSIAHGSLLLLERSKWFLPWYSIWPLTFVPFIKEELIHRILILFTLSGLLSYIPYLYYGEYSLFQEWFKRGVLWGMPILAVLFGTYIMPRIKIKS